MAANPTSSDAPPMVDRPVKRKASSRRSGRRNRRYGTQDPSTTSSNTSAFSCCISAEDSPEREFWNDVVFITPQGTPKLSIRDASRHSTLNFTPVVSPNSLSREERSIVKKVTIADVCGDVPVVQANISPVNAQDVPLRLKSLPRDATAAAKELNEEKCTCGDKSAGQVPVTSAAQVHDSSANQSTSGAPGISVKQEHEQDAANLSTASAASPLSSSSTPTTNTSLQSAASVQTSSLPSAPVSPAIVSSGKDDTQTKAGIAQPSSSTVASCSTNLSSSSLEKPAPVAVVGGKENCTTMKESTPGEKESMETTQQVEKEEVEKPVSSKTDELKKSSAAVAAAAVEAKATDEVPTDEKKLNTAVKKSAETQTDLGEAVISSASVSGGEANACQAVSTNAVPITIPTALGEIVLHSPPIMSCGVSAQRGNVSMSSYCHNQPSHSVMASPIPYLSGSTPSSSKPPTPHMSSAVSSVVSSTAVVPSVPNLTKSESNSNTVAPSVPIRSDSIFTSSTNRTDTSNQSNRSPASTSITQTPRSVEDAIPQQRPISSSAIATNNREQTSQVSMETCKNERNLQPVSPTYSNIPCITSGESCQIDESERIIKDVHESDKGITKWEPDAPTHQTVITEQAEKKAKVQMEDILRNKPAVQNLVLVKRQSQANTPKILRKTQVPPAKGQTIHRTLIKGEERKRLTKSIESLDDVVLDLDIAYEYVRRKNYRTSFIGDVAPCTDKQTVYEDNSFGDVQTIIKHTKKENIYALPQPASYGEDTMQAVKRITDKYNTPQRWKLQAKSFESSLQRPTTVTMAGKGTYGTLQQPHVVMATPPSISAPYMREKARLGLFYRSFAAEICICDCLADLKQRNGPNDPWLPMNTGRPLLVFNTGEGRRRRQLQLVLADSNTALPLWSDYITYLSEFRPEDSIPNPRVVHQLRLSTNLRTQVFIEYYNTRAAADFYSRFTTITSDPGDTLWMVSGDKSSLKQLKKRRRKTVSDKSAISQPCHFAHVTHIEPMRIPPELDLPFATSRVRSRSFSEDLNG